MIKTWQERLDEMAHFDQRGYEENMDTCKLEEVAELRVELKAAEEGLNELREELNKLKQQEPAYLLTPGGYVVGARLDAGHAPGTLTKLYFAAGAQPAQKLLFPTMLRKMWSGSEVQAWLDEQAKEKP